MIHNECGTPWDEHIGNGPNPVCPDRALRDLSNEERERLAERPERSKPFEARFPGECAQGDRIAKGDGVHYVDNELQHVSCPGLEADVTIPEVRRPICPVHFVEVPLSGVCPDCE